MPCCLCWCCCRCWRLLLPVLAALLLQPASAALVLLPKLLPALLALLPAVPLLAASRLAAVG